MNTLQRKIFLVLSVLSILMVILLVGCDSSGNRDIENIEKELSRLQTEKQGWVTDAELQEQSNRFQRQIDILQSRLSTLEGQVAADEKQITTLKARPTNENEILRLQEKINSSQSQIDNLQSQINNLLQRYPYYPYPPYPTPTPTPFPYSPGQFIATVYSGENFGNYVVGTFNESDIHHTWGSGGLLGLTDHFSVRWEGIFWLEAGNYRFRVLTEDGARLFVNGQILIDKWFQQTLPTVYEQTISLPQGYHNIRLDYFESTGNALIELWRWNY